MEKNSSINIGNMLQQYATMAEAYQGRGSSIGYSKHAEDGLIVKHTIKLIYGVGRKLQALLIDKGITLEQKARIYEELQLMLQRVAGKAFKLSITVHVTFNNSKEINNVTHEKKITRYGRIVVQFSTTTSNYLIDKNTGEAIVSHIPELISAWRSYAVFKCEQHIDKK